MVQNLWKMQQKETDSNKSIAKIMQHENEHKELTKQKTNSAS